MPEYLAPGVYLEEVPFRSKSIDGVSTTTAGFVGPARFGPIALAPCVITSLREFERVYGDGSQLAYNDSGQIHNYLWHAARAFFAEGGRRLYIARVFRPQGSNDDGIARSNVPAAGGATALGIQARFPGAFGNFLIRFTVRMGANILAGATGAATVGGLQENDVVWIGKTLSSPLGPTVAGDLYLALWDPSEQTWRFGKSKTKSAADLRVNVLADTSASVVPLDPEGGDQLRVVDVAVTVLLNDGSMRVWSQLSPDPAHQRAGSPDGLFARFPITTSSQPPGHNLPLVIAAGDSVSDGLDVLNALFAAKSSLRPALDEIGSTELDRSIDVLLSGGNDGVRPTAGEYEGGVDLAAADSTGLKAFEGVEEISIVAAPGATFGFQGGYEVNARAIVSHLIAHAERMRYRIAVIDSGDGLGISEVRAMRAMYDSKSAAFYYPWVRILDPVTRLEIDLPPSAFVSAIYARNDIERGVHKAPANQVVNMAIGLETLLNEAQQEVLNPEGINCLRFFEGGGYRVWGARTISSDPEWKYVSLRRYCAYLERSIACGTQWTVFDPNGEGLWANVRRNIENFLLNEWQMGALMGDKPEKAFFVRCDNSTMTQNDLDNGRLICLIGIAPLRPAEFVIFRIGQWTVDRRC